MFFNIYEFSASFVINFMKNELQSGTNLFMPG